MLIYCFMRRLKNNMITMSENRKKVVKVISQLRELKICNNRSKIILSKTTSKFKISFKIIPKMAKEKINYKKKKNLIYSKILNLF